MFFSTTLPSHWSQSRRCAYIRQEMARLEWSKHAAAVDARAPREEIERLATRAESVEKIPDSVIIEAEELCN